MIKILVAEDEQSLNRIVCATLTDSGFDAHGFLNVADAYDAMENTIFDMIITDIMMPGTDGFEFAQSVRDTDKIIPILFMTARDDIAAKRRGFRLGIDDYMVKPVDMQELVLRVNALLRRANIMNEKKLTIGGVTLDIDERAAYINGDALALSAKEFGMLFKMLSYPKKTFTRSQLMDEFWGPDSESTPRTVDVYITKLREKVKDCQDFEIVTVHGLGYKAVLK